MAMPLEENEYERMLREQLNAAPVQQEAPLDIGQLGAALAQSANQLGTVGGRTADSSGLKDYADTMTKYKQNQQANMLAQNTKRQDILAKLAQLKDTQNMKNMLLADKDTSKDSAHKNALELEDVKFKHQLALEKQKAGNQQEKIKPPTADERTSAMFATRAKDAADLADTIEGSGYNPASYGASFRSTKLPFVGTVGAKPEDRSYNQAKRSFIAAVLRKESGASISDTEFDRENARYFPEPGDPPDLVKQKAAERQRAVDTLITASGGAYNPASQRPFDYKKPTASPDGLIAAPVPNNAPQVGDVVKGYRYKGGNPADKSSWEKE